MHPRGTLPEANPHPPPSTPCDVARVLHVLRPDDQHEGFWNMLRVFNLEACTGRGDVAHNALDAASLGERNRAAFKNSVSRSSTAFHTITLSLAYCDPVKFATNWP
jgi:hypothetical protein